GGIPPRQGAGLQLPLPGGQPVPGEFRHLGRHLLPVPGCVASDGPAVGRCVVVARGTAPPPVAAGAGVHLQQLLPDLRGPLRVALRADDLLEPLSGLFAPGTGPVPCGWTAALGGVACRWHGLLGARTEPHLADRPPRLLGHPDATDPAVPVRTATARAVATPG